MLKNIQRYIKKFDLLLKKIPFNKLIKLNKNQMFEQINSIKGFSDKSSKRFVDRITLFIKFLDNHKKLIFKIYVISIKNL